ncbi:MAG: efflux RND transporter permease subunit [Candidatus Thiodiazotropha sp. (ex Monitilora ramsayi)]|nr:efflux RND transporter permease subunit [Candidatus Thiodiazotropha sp. (ex Monitilora ramsayi)]
MSQSDSVQDRGNHTAFPETGLWGFFFLRPTLGILLSLLFIFSGYLAWKGMVKESNPDLDIPMAMVETEWVGADPETVEQSVTSPLERELKSLDGLTDLRSGSFNSFSLISVEFDADADTTDAMNRLRAAVDVALPDLPTDVERPLVTQKSVTDTPVITYALYGEVGPTTLGRVASFLQDRLEKVAGVSEVELSGEREEIVRINLDIRHLAALGLSPVQVRDAIQQANQDMPWDRLDSEHISGTMRLYGRFREVEDLERTPVMRMENGRVVYLSEIAEVRRDLERESSRAALSWKSGPYQPTVDVSVKKLPGFDSLKLIEEVQRVVAEEHAKARWPHGVSYAVTSDQSEQILGDLSNVLNNGWQAMLGVFLVLLVVLTWREAMVAGLAIPLTFLATLAFLWITGNTFNKLVIVGLVLALGLLVDIFILMMEGMHEGIFSRRLSFNQAALKTIRSYAGPAFAGQMTTILALAPLLAIGGVSGKFIRIIPITTIVALVMSFIIALLVAVPLSRFLLDRVKRDAAPSRIDRLTKRGEQWLHSWSLKHSLRSRRIATVWVAASVGMLSGSLFLAGQLALTMYPMADGRNLGVTVEMPPDTTLDQSQACADALGETLKEKDWFQSVVKFAGAKSPMALNSPAEALNPAKDSYLVGFSAYFTPAEERELFSFEYLDALRTELSADLRACPGGQLTLTPQLSGASSEDPIQIIVEGDDLDQLRRISVEIQEALRQISGAADVRDSMGPVRIDVKAHPRREALDFYRISVSDLGTQVRMAMTDDVIGSYVLGGTEEDLDIRMGILWESREGEPGGPTTVAELAQLQISLDDGRFIPFFSLVDLEVNDASLVIGHTSGERAITVKSKSDGRTAGEILQELRPQLEEMQKAWGDGYSYRFGGEAEDTAETFGDSVAMMGVALFLVFALLVVQFDSFRQPIIILTSVPLAFIGVFSVFYLAGVPISFPAMVGVIALIGIVVNNAIVMIDNMNVHFKAGKGRQESAAIGAAERLRPILATTATTIIGLIPLALSDPFWMPLCLAIISGLLVATLIALFIIPCLYLLLSGEDAVVVEA